MDHDQSTVVSGLNTDHATAVSHNVLMPIWVLCLSLSEPIQDVTQVFQINNVHYGSIVVRILTNAVHQE